MIKLLLLAGPIALILSGCVGHSGMRQQRPSQPQVVRIAPPPVQVAQAVQIAQPPPPQAVRVVQPIPPDVDVVVVYEDVLGRPPSPREVGDWRERARHQPFTGDDVRRELRSGHEFQNSTPESVILRAYRDFLHREPDGNEMRAYRRRMLDEGWSIGHVRRSIADAAREGRRGSEVRPNRPDSRLSGRPAHAADVIIDRAYDDLLEREPDAAGFERYRKLLQRGQTEQQIRAQIKESVEYRVTLPDSKTTRAYREVLEREPDASGLESYRRKIVDSGWTEEDVKRDLRNSAEYRNRKDRKH